MAKPGRVAIYNCDTGNFDTNDQTDDWYSQAHYDNNWYYHDQTLVQQLALPQPRQLADPSVVPISGEHEATVAMIGAAQRPERKLKGSSKRNWDRHQNEKTTKGKPKETKGNQRELKRNQRGTNTTQKGNQRDAKKKETQIFTSLDPRGA